MYQTVVINVDELWLKGKNRQYYVKSLQSHIRELLRVYHPADFKCNTEEHRMVTSSAEPFSEETIQALLKIPGIHSLLPCRGVEVSLEALCQAVKEELGQMETLPPSFKVETRRSFKGFPMTSMDVSREVGAFVLSHFPTLKVDVKNPELLIDIRIMAKNSYVASRRLLGIGGLPVGPSGHIITLISGGFDSPVASYLMSKRGCRQTFIFFYAYPFVGNEVKEKILALMKVLGQYQRFSRLYIVPFGDVQDLIAKNCDTDYRTLLFRRAMLQCAQLLARRVKAEALLTGDSLGQVSSQTIGNMTVLENSVDLPVFRPLLGFNKSEILALAKEIGTHDISVIPHDDACSLFAPRHPVINPLKSTVASFAAQLSLQEHLEHSLAQAEVFYISLKGSVAKTK